MMKKIYFITTNKSKFKEVGDRLSVLPIELIQTELDTEEKRTFDILEITKDKLRQAKEAFPNRALMVDDRGFFIESLNGFPGSFVKLLLNSIKIDGLIRLMSVFVNRSAKFTTVLGYFNGKSDFFFKADENGFITDTIREGDIRGWTDLLYVYGYNKYPNRALCELNNNEWNEYMMDIAKNDQIEQFIEFYKKQLI